jgi:hypothetical protein
VLPAPLFEIVDERRALSLINGELLDLFSQLSRITIAMAKASKS